MMTAGFGGAEVWEGGAVAPKNCTPGLEAGRQARCCFVKICVSSWHSGWGREGTPQEVWGFSSYATPPQPFFNCKDEFF